MGPGASSNSTAANTAVSAALKLSILMYIVCTFLKHGLHQELHAAFKAKSDF